MERWWKLSFFDNATGMGSLDARLFSKVANSISAILLVVLAASNASQCATVSCAADSGELSDRVSSISLTMHAAGSTLVWMEKRALAALASMDVSLLLVLAVLSSDVAPTVHNYVALSFIIVRVILIISDSTAGCALDLLTLYMVVCLRSFSQFFVFGYACPNVIPEVCDTISASTPLSQSAALFLETCMVVCNLGYMIFAVDSRPGWKSDVALPAALAVAVLGNLFIALLRWSPTSALLLAVGSSIDLALVIGLWSRRGDEKLKYESLPLAVLIFAPLVYALV